MKNGNVPITSTGSDQKLPRLEEIKMSESDYSSDQFEAIDESIQYVHNIYETEDEEATENLFNSSFEEFKACELVIGESKYNNIPAPRSKHNVVPPLNLKKQQQVFKPLTHYTKISKELDAKIQKL